MMSRIDLAKSFDHTLLKAEACSEQIEFLCDQANEYGFASVCINPVWLGLAKKRLKGPMAITVVGFPLGASPTAVKVYETRWAIEHGADEIDMVINVADVIEGRSAELAIDIQSVVKVASGKAVKVILETCYLQPHQIALASVIAADQGVSFVKTSTGFGSRGASVEDIQTMRHSLDQAGHYDVQIKASGGIRTLNDALSMLEAGASRLGASASVSIMKEYDSGSPSDSCDLTSY